MAPIWACFIVFNRSHQSLVKLIPIYTRLGSLIMLTSKIEISGVMNSHFSLILLSPRRLVRNAEESWALSQMY